MLITKLETESAIEPVRFAVSCIGVIDNFDVT